MIVGVLVGVGALGAGGFAVWYFFFHGPAYRAAEEALELMQSFVDALEKAQHTDLRPQAIKEINEVSQRMERYIQKYGDHHWSEEERWQVQQKYGDRAKALDNRRVGAILLMTISIAISRREDAELSDAVKRAEHLMVRVRFSSPLPPSELPF
jgi:hypothetical protein